LLGLRQPAAQVGRLALPRQHRQPPLQRAAAALRQVLPQQAPPQHRVRGLGQRVALAMAERLVLAEEGADDAVGRLVHLQHVAQQLRGEVQQGGGVHGSGVAARTVGVVR